MTDTFHPALPWPGLLSALSAYSAKGQLFNALAAVQGQQDVWSANDVRRRARRILFEQVIPSVLRLPESPVAWIEALPAQSHRERVVSEAPAGRVSWPQTRAHGWPPRRYVTHTRFRTPDEVLVTTLAWVARRLLAVAEDATVVIPGADTVILRQLTTMRQLMAVPPVSDASPEPPGRPELAAVRTSGRPWAALAQTAELLRFEDSHLDDLARQLLIPDPELRWRLFHLGCLGTMVSDLQERGWVVVSRRPLGIGSGPSHFVRDPDGRTWELWFEAGGIWKHYGIPSPYVEATRFLPGAGQPLGADLALIRFGETAIALECKYSSDPTYVARDGYLQALSYLTELHTAVAPAVSTVVIGPDGIVTGTSSTTTSCGKLSITSPSGLGELLPR